MRQMQYHGIASYTFEYKLSTAGNWTTALTQTSANYTCEGLTGGKSYDLRVTVTDRAGNSSTGTNTGTTKKPEKNPGGVIEDITSDPSMDLTTNTSDLTKLEKRRVNYKFDEKTVHISQDIAGKEQEIKRSTIRILVYTA